MIFHSWKCHSFVHLLLVNGCSLNNFKYFDEFLAKFLCAPLIISLARKITAIRFLGHMCSVLRFWHIISFDQALKMFYASTLILAHWNCRFLTPELLENEYISVVFFSRQVVVIYYSSHKKLHHHLMTFSL